MICFVMLMGRWFCNLCAEEDTIRSYFCCERGPGGGGSFNVGGIVLAFGGFILCCFYYSYQELGYIFYCFERPP